jgi:hypothetical protein
MIRKTGCDRSRPRGEFGVVKIDLRSRSTQRLNEASPGAGPAIRGVRIAFGDECDSD